MKHCIRCLLPAILLIALILSGCNVSKMPFNGDISFHDLSLTIDKRFIRDSTQSTRDLWIFEHGGYSEYVILSRQDAPADVTASLEDYAAYLTEEGAEAELTEFLGCEAVSSSYTKDGKACREILFAYSGSLYAIALRGGDEEGFRALTDSVRIHKGTEEQS